MADASVTLSEIVERGALTKLEALRFKATFPCQHCGTGANTPARPYNRKEVEALLTRIAAAFPEHDDAEGNSTFGIDIGH